MLHTIIAQVGSQLISKGVSYVVDYLFSDEEELKPVDAVDPGLSHNIAREGEPIPVVFGTVAVPIKIFNGGDVVYREDDSSLYPINRDFPDAEPGGYYRVGKKEELYPIKPIEFVVCGNSVDAVKSFRLRYDYPGMEEVRLVPYFSLGGWGDHETPILEHDVSDVVLVPDYAPQDAAIFDGDEVFDLASDGIYFTSVEANIYYRGYYPGSVYLQSSWDPSYRQNNLVSPGWLYPDSDLLAGDIDYRTRYFYRIGAIVPAWLGSVTSEAGEEYKKGAYFPTEVTALVVNQEFAAGRLDQDFAKIGPDANPVHVLYWMLSDTVYGRGLPDEAIDLESFDEAAEVAHGLGLGVSMALPPGDIQGHASELLGLVDGLLHYDRSSGKLKIVTLSEDDTPKAAFDDSNAVCEWTRETPDMSPTGISATYTGWTDFYEPYHTREMSIDYAAPRAEEESRVVSVSYPYLRDSRPVQLRMTRDYLAAQRHYTTISLQVPFTPVTAALEVGDVIEWGSVAQDVPQLPYKVTTVSLGASDSNTVSIEARSNWVSTDESIVPDAPDSRREAPEVPDISGRAIGLDKYLAWYMGLYAQGEDREEFFERMSFKGLGDLAQQAYIVEDAEDVQTIAWWTRRGGSSSYEYERRGEAVRAIKTRLSADLASSTASYPSIEAPITGSFILLVGNELIVSGLTDGESSTFFGDTRRGIFDTTMAAETVPAGEEVYILGETAPLRTSSTDLRPISWQVNVGDLRSSSQVEAGIFQGFVPGAPTPRLSDLPALSEPGGQNRMSRPLPPSSLTVSYGSGELSASWWYRDPESSLPSETDLEPELSGFRYPEVILLGSSTASGVRAPFYSSGTDLASDDREFEMDDADIVQEWVNSPVGGGPLRRIEVRVYVRDPSIGRSVFYVSRVVSVNL